MIYYNTNYNVIDIFTKPLGKVKFVIGKENLKMVENPFYKNVVDIFTKPLGKS